MPLLLPKAVTASEDGVEGMFSGARYLVEQARRVFDINPKDNAKGEQIVLHEEAGGEGVNNYVAESLFDVTNTSEPQLVVDLKPAWDSSLFDVIPGLIVRNGYTQWDNFHGTADRVLNGTAAPQTAVPEPATGALVALGLAALALRAKRA